MPGTAKNSRKTRCQQQDLPKQKLAPCPRDQRAFRLSSRGWSQRRIAKKLKCSQPTVLRGIRKTERWMGTTLPEDRGEMTGEEKLRVAVARHTIFLESLKRKALREWERSQETRRVKRTKTKKYPEGRKHGGEQITEVHTDEYDQPQYGRVGCLNAAARYSHELNVLAAGYVGQGNGCIGLEEVVDPDERQRWKREVQSRDARIAELEKVVAELKAARAVGCMSASEMHAECGPLSARLSSDNETSSRVHFADAHAPYADVSAPTETESVLNHEAANCEDVSPKTCERYHDTSDSAVAQSSEVQNMNRGISCQLVPAANTDKLAACATENKLAACPTRWSEKDRQEALDYHCKTTGLPWACVNQASGIPDPKSISPKLAMQRGYPYLIYIDWSIKPDRPPPPDERKVIQLATWE